MATSTCVQGHSAWWECFHRSRRVPPRALSEGRTAGHRCAPTRGLCFWCWSKVSAYLDIFPGWRWTLIPRLYQDMPWTILCWHHTLLHRFIHVACLQHYSLTWWKRHADTILNKKNIGNNIVSRIMRAIKDSSSLSQNWCNAHFALNLQVPRVIPSQHQTKKFVCGNSREGRSCRRWLATVTVD